MNLKIKRKEVVKNRMVSYPLLPDRLQKVVLLNMEVSGDKKLI
jgi:hypothetical protein